MPLRGHVILSHGLESGPQATKVAALAAMAESLGWSTERPDFLDLDRERNPARIADRSGPSARPLSCLFRALGVGWVQHGRIHLRLGVLAMAGSRLVSDGTAARIQAV